MGDKIHSTGHVMVSCHMHGMALEGGEGREGREGRVGRWTNGGSVEQNAKNSEASKCFVYTNWLIRAF